MKVKCFFCEATVDDIPEHMVKGSRRPSFGRRRKWLPKEAETWPGFRWYQNGIYGAGPEGQFFLCPNHQSPEYLMASLLWASKQIKLTGGKGEHE